MDGRKVGWRDKGSLFLKGNSYLLSDAFHTSQINAIQFNPSQQGTSYVPIPVSKANITPQALETTKALPAESRRKCQSQLDIKTSSVGLEQNAKRTYPGGLSAIDS
ncbi:hypothetical protein AAF712_012043 [Marasmius tenuissimus]|uniref:Uncharacterized protein n=1 Tax=Marasmius tenuissimus TaxID=585030 RepID=A0ABR2ZII5_9AGAR